MHKNAVTVYYLLLCGAGWVDFTTKQFCLFQPCLTRCSTSCSAQRRVTACTSSSLACALVAAARGAPTWRWPPMTRKVACLETKWMKIMSTQSERTEATFHCNPSKKKRCEDVGKGKDPCPIGFKFGFGIAKKKKLKLFIPSCSDEIW